MPLRKLLAYATIYLVWGASFLAIREIVAPGTGHLPIPPFFAAGLRLSLAGAILLFWARLSGRATAFPLTARQLLSACILGFLMFTCDYASLFWGEVRVASGITAVIFAMIPIWIFAGELVLRTQRATPLSIAGVTLGFSGVVFLTLRSGPSPHTPTSPVAVLVMMGGALCWAIGTLWSRHLPLPRPHQVNVGWQILAGGLLMLVLAALSGELSRLPPPTVFLNPRVLVSFAYLILPASIGAYSAYVWLLRHDSPTRVASYAYINPVFALLLGAALAGERLTPPQILGVSLILTGVIATLTGKQKAAASVPRPPFPSSARR